MLMFHIFSLREIEFFSMKENHALDKPIYKGDFIKFSTVI